MTATRKSRKGRKSPSLTKDQIISKSKIICDHYAAGEDTIESVCKALRVQYRTFKVWGARFSEVSELYIDAKKTKQDLDPAHLKRLAKSALRKKLEGYEDDETATREIVPDEQNPQGPPKVSKTKITRRKYQPDSALIKFALINLDPEHYRDTQEHELGKETMSTLFDYLAQVGRRSRLSPKAKGIPKAPGEAESEEKEGPGA